MDTLNFSVKMHTLNMAQTLDKNISCYTLALTCLIAFYLLYVPLLDGYFISDDTQWIWFSSSKSVWQILFSPLDYRMISAANFTPLLGLSFKLDWNLFGLQPKGYYLHSLMSLVLTIHILYKFLRLYTPSTVTMLAVNLFILNPATLSVTSWLSTRHYLEGLLFCLWALYLQIKYHDSSPNRIASGLLYLLSSLCKETYVIVPCIALLLVDGDIKARLKKTSLMWVVLVLYMLWRIFMLGGLGGYVGSLAKEGLINVNLVRHIFIDTPSLIFGNYYPIFWLGVFVVAMTVLIEKPISLIKAFILLALVTLPIIPVMNAITLRFFFTGSIAVIALFAVFISGVRSNRHRLSIALLIITLCFPFIVKKDKEILENFSSSTIIHKRAAMAFTSNTNPYILAETVPWFYEGLRSIYEFYYGQIITTAIVPPATMQKYISVDKRDEIREAGIEISDAIQSKTNPGITIKGLLTLNGYSIKWAFDIPTTQCKVHLLLGDKSGIYTYMQQLPKIGSYRFGRYYPDDREQRVFMKVVYLCPEGREMVSDEFVIKIPSDMDIAFE